MTLRLIVTAMTFAASALVSTAAGATVVSDWNAAALAEVRADKLGPPIVARALAIAHTCMYDAWAGDDLRRPRHERTDANKAEAVSFAAYCCLPNLFPAGATRLTAVMTALGYNAANTSVDVTTPAGIGNVVVAAVIEDRRDDGSNQYGALNGGAPYSDYTGYVPRNDPMPYCLPTMAICPPAHIADPFHWQPLIGPPGLGSVTQKYIGPFWENVRAVRAELGRQYDHLRIAEPRALKNLAQLRKAAEEVLRHSAELDDEKKLIVEYWADGPASELPPGHWGLFAQFVSARDNHSIDQDAKVFFAYGGPGRPGELIPANFGRVERGSHPIPAVDTTISYETFSDAAEAAALSRIYGGIHFSEDNDPGLALGKMIGGQAWEKAERYFHGTAR